MRPQPVARELSDLSAALGLPTPSGAVVVSGITHDSRRVQAGDLYAALPGANAHGAQFVTQARDAGAVGVLTDPYGFSEMAVQGNDDLPSLVLEDPRSSLGQASSWVYGDPSHKLAIVGITGTDGKTTAATLAEAALVGCGIATGLIGTVINRFGDRVFDGGRTTPEAPDLHAMLALMLEAGAQAVVMEVSSHALELSRVAGVRFSLAVFTNLSHDHLDFHGSIESYFAAKRRLFTPEYSSAGLVCADDEWGRLLASQAAIPTATYGIGDTTGADWRVSNLALGVDATSFDVRGPGIEIAGACRLPGDFNVRNALAAAASAITLGAEPACAFAAVARSPGVSGRMERVVVEDGAELPAAFVDYAHTPDAVGRALGVGRSIAEATGGRVLVAFGCGGDRDAGKRAEMGAVAAALADVLVITDDNPRSEDPATIRAAIRAGVPEEDPRAVVHEIGDRRAALNWLIANSEQGDVVLALGKGHETTQEVAGELYAFDDRLELAAAMTMAAMMAEQR